MRGHRTSIDLTVAVDLSDVFGEISRDELVAELRSRGVTEEGEQAIQAAMAQLRRGDHLDALTTLEREFDPKWSSADESRRAYEKAMSP